MERWQVEKLAEVEAREKLAKMKPYEVLEAAGMDPAPDAYRDEESYRDEQFLAADEFVAMYVARRVEEWEAREKLTPTMHAALCAMGASKRSREEVERALAEMSNMVENLTDELRRERSKRVELAMDIAARMVELKMEGKELAFAKAVAGGGTQAEIAARYNAATGEHREQSWVSRMMQKFEKKWGGLLKEGGGGEYRAAEGGHRVTGGKKAAVFAKH